MGVGGGGDVVVFPFVLFRERCKQPTGGKESSWRIILKTQTKFKCGGKK